MRAVTVAFLPCGPQVDHGAHREALGEGSRLLEEEGEV